MKKERMGYALVRLLLVFLLVGAGNVYAQSSATLNAEGKKAFTAGKFDDAEKSYTRSLQLDAKNVEALYHLGVINQQKGKNKEAIDFYLRAIKEDDKHVLAHYNLATIYEKDNKKADAKKYYEACLKLDPKNANAQKGLDRVK
jgi:tetratricopeptide (TPR) repeat protein